MLGSGAWSRKTAGWGVLGTCCGVHVWKSPGWRTQTQPRSLRVLSVTRHRGRHVVEQWILGCDRGIAS